MSMKLLGIITVGSVVIELQDDSKLLSGFPWPIIFKPEIIK
jgi:hypothetical protein